MSNPRSPEETVELALLAASLVPAGRVVTYGDVAELVGTSARRVGAIMREHGHPVPYWRVISASGALVCLATARDEWAAEGIEVRPDGRGCRLADYRADLVTWADAFERVRPGERPVGETPAAPGARAVV